MVVYCWVKGCTNRGDKTVKRSFHYIPMVRLTEGEKTKELSEERRRVWLANINRKDQLSKTSRICSDHFITGKPADLYDRSNPDWAPTLMLTDTLTPTKSEKKRKRVETDKKRYERIKERGQNREKHHAARALLDLASELTIPEHGFLQTTELSEDCDLYMEDGLVMDIASPRSPDHEEVAESAVNSEIQRLLDENRLLRQQLRESKMNEDFFQGQDDKVKYYTGLPSFVTLMCLFSFVKDYIPTPRVCSELGLFERVIMTLMRLKLNLPVQDLAYRFKTSTSTASRTFLVVIHVLYIRLKHLLYWPEREEIRKTMPLEFRKSFGEKTAVIIDCFEVFIQRPKNLLARAQTWSSYKHSNTVKFLIGITPQGSVSFLSRAWGGRASDKWITEHCGILQKLLPGDLVLADRGFDIADSVGMFCAQINVPAFTKGKTQLSAVDVETTCKIAHVRIHVERVIGLVRNKYTMLQGRLPVDFLLSDEGDGLPVVDKVATVACALSNMCESVVPFN